MRHYIIFTAHCLLCNTTLLKSECKCGAMTLVKHPDLFGHVVLELDCLDTTFVAIVKAVVSQDGAILHKSTLPTGVKDKHVL